MWKAPSSTMLTFPLLGGGRIEFGYGSDDGGMSVCTPPLMARITVTEGWGHYPDIWFCVGKDFSVMKLKSMFKENDANFIPDWLRADCYEGAYYQLINSNPVNPA